MASNMKDLLTRMSDIAEEVAEHTLPALIFGASGTGKTTLAVDLAQQIRSDTGKIIYIDSAEGYVTLEETPHLLENVTRVAYKEYSDFALIAHAIRTKQARFKNAQVVIIDELDSISDDVLDKLVRAKHNTLPEEPTPEIEGSDHRPMADKMMAALRDFKALGLHIILVAHDNTSKDDRNIERTFAALSPKYRARVFGLMHVVAHATAQIKTVAGKTEYTREIQAMPTVRIESKTRVAALRTKVKHTHEEFVTAITNWVYSDAADAELADTTTVVPEDEPLYDTATEAVASEVDDAPAYVE